MEREDKSDQDEKDDSPHCQMIRYKIFDHGFDKHRTA